MRPETSGLRRPAAIRTESPSGRPTFVVPLLFRSPSLSLGKPLNRRPPPVLYLAKSPLRDAQLRHAYERPCAWALDENPWTAPSAAVT
jgi:hypothetical protein